VTNGISDQAIVLDQKRPDRPRRRELIQYVTDCQLPKARALRDMAWLPLFDGFLLDTREYALPDQETISCPANAGLRRRPKLGAEVLRVCALSRATRLVNHRTQGKYFTDPSYF
jgi:hypothetical protein